jgi:hypothetical protein
MNKSINREAIIDPQTTVWSKFPTLSPRVRWDATRSVPE